VAQLDARSVVADGLARQHLRDDALGTDAVQVARDVVGLHATGAPNPYLQLLVRCVGFDRSMLDRELYERRTLVRARCMRGTLFVLPLDLLPIAWAATRTGVLNASTAYLASQGLTVAAYERWAVRIESLLTGRALSAAQVRSALQVGREVPVSAVLNQMCDEGRLLRDRPVAGWRDARNTYRRFSEALPQVRLDSCSPAEATRQLVARYIARYGPITLADIAWWTGVGISRCRTALAELEDQVLPVRVSGWDGDYVIVRADLDRMLHAAAPRPTQLSLLASLDPYTMGFRDRARMLDAGLHDFVYDRSGNATSVVIIDGRVAGVWNVLADHGKARFFLFATPSTAVEERLRDGLAAVSAVITGSPMIVKRSDHMTPLTERRAGWVLKPLHD
jgi:DNA glycosylase AlkZ-like